MADKYSEFLCLCWLGALLHDIGKLSVSFLISKERNSPIPDRHGQIIFSDRDRVPAPLLEFLTAPLDDLCTVPEGLRGYSLLYFICSHHGCERCGGNHCCGSTGMSSHPLTEILQSADRLESSNPPDLLKQSLLTVKRSDFFGLEYSLYPHRFSAYREKIYQGLLRIFGYDSRPNPFRMARVSKLLSSYLSRGLSETRRRAHDINIYSHSHATAVYMKLILIDLLNTASARGSRQWSTLLIEPKYRILKVPCIDERSRELIHRLEVTKPCGALIYGAPGELFFFVGATVSEEKISMLLDCPFLLSPPRFAGLPLNDDDGYIYHSPQPHAHTICLDLRQCTALTRNLKVAEPEEIDPHMTLEKICMGLEQTLAYPDFCLLLSLRKKKRALARHIAHLEQGITFRADPGMKKAIETARRRMGELEQMEKARDSVEKKAREWGWRSRGDAAATVWNFLSKVLSPVRPPHMAHLAGKWNRYIAEGIQGDELARILILSKQMNLSRLFSLLGDTGRFFHRLARKRQHSMTMISLTLPDDDMLSLFHESSWCDFESSFIIFGQGHPL